MGTEELYEYLLERAKLRLQSAQQAYEQALREQEQAAEYMEIGPDLFREMTQLELEIRKAVYDEEELVIPGDGQLRMATSRRAFSSFAKMKAFAAVPAVSLLSLKILDLIRICCGQ